MTVTAPLVASSAASIRRQVWRSGAVTLSLWIWCALLSFPLIGVDAYESPDNRVLIYQAAGWLQFVVVAAFALPHSVATALGRLSRFQATMVGVILLSLAVQFHGPETAVLSGIGYTLALLVTIFWLASVWTMRPEALATCFGGIGVVLAAFGITAIAVLGWPDGRRVGGIHPNALGGIMLAGFVASQFSTGLAMLGVRLVCVALAAAVSSRFAVIGCGLAFLVFELRSARSRQKLVLLALAGVVGLALSPQLLMDVLALDDPARNLDSGFTGRDDLWKSALAGIAESPFGVGFKRPPVEQSGHNGYLKWLAEFGVIGGGVLIASTLCIAATAVMDAAAAAGAGDRLHRFAAARAAGLVAMTFASFFQPQLFNLGDIHGLTVMLLLFSPPVGSAAPIEGARARG